MSVKKNMFIPVQYFIYATTKKIFIDYFMYPGTYFRYRVYCKNEKKIIKCKKKSKLNFLKN